MPRVFSTHYCLVTVSRGAGGAFSAVFAASLRGVYLSKPVGMNIPVDRPGRARLPPGDLYADYVLSDHPTTQIALSRPTTLSDHPPPSGWTIRPPSATGEVPRCGVIS